MSRTDLKAWFSENKKKRICEVCGAVYVPITANQKYCTIECQRKARRKHERIQNDLPVSEELSENMKQIYAMVKDDPGYGLKVAREEGRIK